MSDDLRHLVTWHNGEKAYLPFTDGEMAGRQTMMRQEMFQGGLDACIFTSYHNICYFSGFLYCAFGRRYAMVLTPDSATTVTPAIDGGQPWRRSFADNLTYTDWRRDNHFRALQQVIGGVKRIGIEFDHVSLDLWRLFEAAFPGVELVDVAETAMRLRTVKSVEEHSLIRESARICRIGGTACMATGATEVAPARHAKAAERPHACAPPSIAGQVPAGLPAKPGLGKTWTSQARPHLPQAHQQQLSSQNYRSCSGPPWTLRLSQFCVQGNRVRLKNMTLTPSQCRAARALLEWSQTRLGESVALSLSTIRDFEKGRRVPHVNNLTAIMQSLESAGVEFIDANGGGPGVRLKG